MFNKITQREKAIGLLDLHYTASPLILPNIWDVLGARLLEDLGYPAIATASASIAYTNGYHDGENIPYEHLLSILTRIAASVNVPVTADIESGYTDDTVQLKENLTRVIKTGIAGINIEDTRHKTKTIYSIEDQCDRISLIRACAEELNVPLVINARTDVLLYNNEYPNQESQFDALIKRGLAYKEAGADCFFPIALKDKDQIENLVSILKMPVNILTLPGIPNLNTLKEIGVARVSLGPSFLKASIKAMKTLALELKDSEGLASITGNEITSDYLKELINK